MGTCLQTCTLSTVLSSGIEECEIPHDPVPPKNEESAPPAVIEINPIQKSHLEFPQKLPKELL